jgi:hypothetical protein
MLWDQRDTLQDSTGVTTSKRSPRPGGKISLVVFYVPSVIRLYPLLDFEIPVLSDLTSLMFLSL